MNRKLIWAVACFALLAVVLAIGARKFAASPASEDAVLEETTAVISLYNERPNVHVADIGVGPKGARLISAGDPGIGDDLRAALAELSARPFLPAMGEGTEGGGTSFGVNETKPGDEQYAWAVAGFLRERTGFKYDIRPYGKPKTP